MLNEKEKNEKMTNQDAAEILQPSFMESCLTVSSKRKTMVERFAEYQGPLRLTEELADEPAGREPDW